MGCGLAHRPKAPGAHVVPGCACGPRGACRNAAPSTHNANGALAALEGPAATPPPPPTTPTVRLRPSRGLRRRKAKPPLGVCRVDAPVAGAVDLAVERHCRCVRAAEGALGRFATPRRRGCETAGARLATPGAHGSSGRKRVPRQAAIAWSVRPQSHGPPGRKRVPCKAASVRRAKSRTHNLGHIPREYGVLSGGIA